MSKARDAMPRPDQAERKMGALVDEQARRQRSGAVRTAWIVGAVAVALFVLSLVQGHRGDLQPSWIPKPVQTEINAVERNAAAHPRASEQTGGHSRVAIHTPTSSRP